MRTLVLLVVVTATPALAIRPFITDDARVVGNHLVQLESWVQLEDGVLQNWVLPALGPTDWLEFTVGFVHGPVHYHHGDLDGPQPSGWGIGGPLVQAKVLLRPVEAWQPPGVAAVLGSLLPFGNGGFRSPPGFFIYAALTQNLGERERVLIHLNLGMSTLMEGQGSAGLLAGLGTQIRLFAGLHLILETVYGDAYTNIDAFALQGGFRYIINDHIQLDASTGIGVAGEPRPFWFTAGLRLVSWELW
jgi:hypothetical protein